MEPQLLTIEQAAEFCQVSAKTIRRAIWAGELKAHRLGEAAALRIWPDQLRAWIEARSTLREREPRTPRIAPVVAANSPVRRRPAGRLRFDDHKKAS